MKCWCVTKSSSFYFFFQAEDGIRDKPARHAALEFPAQCDQISLQLLVPHAGGHESDEHSIPKSYADLATEHLLRTASSSVNERASAPADPHIPAPVAGPKKRRRRRSPSFHVLRFRNRPL